MKTIAIVANKRSFAQHIRENLSAYFDGYASLRVYTTREVEEKTGFEEDAVVLSSWTLFGKVREKITPQNILEAVSFTLSCSNLEKMRQIKGLKRALLINWDYRLCMQVISQLYQAGFEDVDFVPYYGDEASRDKSISVAITPNEAHLAPPDVTLYDIGERAVEPGFVLRLANKLGLEGIFDSPAAERARKEVVLPQWGLDDLLLENHSAKNNIRAILAYIEDGILLCDARWECHIGNEKVKELLRVDEVRGLNLADFLPGKELKGPFTGKKTLIVSVGRKNLVFTVIPVFSEKGRDGYLVVIKNFEEAEEQQHQLRNKVIGAKHEARYTFQDIKGESKAIRSVITLAKRIAKSNSSVVIFGESGTGKEMLAQSIHNESSRRDYNFVALNCAAIPESLMESELFGYEYGAFTGARKEGKIGYFELAHRGTLFFDEVEEMPLSLQGKLLRVIEERKIVRIGSSKLIDVDVRIIAATNQNLKQLVEEGKFRKDLYYRPNVFPIKLPDLNQRGRDVLLLFREFQRDMGARWTYDRNVEQRLLEHQWNGNIRELRNTVEYLDNLEKDVVTLEDLPEDLLTPSPPGRKEPGEPSVSQGMGREEGPWADEEFREFILREGTHLALHGHVLQVLERYETQRRAVGRNQIRIDLEREGCWYTESEIRSSLHKLAEYGYVRTLRGRGGSLLLWRGKHLLNAIKGVLGEKIT